MRRANHDPQPPAFGGAPVVEIQVPANTAIKSPTGLSGNWLTTSELFQATAISAFRAKQEHADAVN